MSTTYVVAWADGTFLAPSPLTVTRDKQQAVKFSDIAQANAAAAKVGGTAVLG